MLQNSAANWTCGLGPPGPQLLCADLDEKLPRFRLSGSGLWSITDDIFHRLSQERGFHFCSAALKEVPDAAPPDPQPQIRHSNITEEQPQRISKGLSNFLLKLHNSRIHQLHHFSPRIFFPQNSPVSSERSTAFPSQVSKCFHNPENKQTTKQQQTSNAIATPTSSTNFCSS